MPDFDVKENGLNRILRNTYLPTAATRRATPPPLTGKRLWIPARSFPLSVPASPISGERFEKIYGADSERQLIDRFCREVKLVGL